MTEVTFSETSGAIAREAGVSPPTVRMYSDLRLIDFVIDSRGCRLYRPGTGKRVREIYAERMARRGRTAA